MFELRPYRKSSVSYYNPFREMADLERSFWGDPDSRNALAEFKTDITGIDAAGIRARYANGVLSLTLPKKAAMQPERTSVEIE